MAYTPSKLKYLKTEIIRNQVIMYFSCGDKRLEIVKQKNKTGKTLTVASDRSEYKKIYNSYLNQEISIEKAKIDNGDIEYSASIIIDGQYYYICGVIKEKDFLNIVGNVYTEK